MHKICPRCVVAAKNFHWLGLIKYIRGLHLPSHLDRPRQNRIGESPAFSSFGPLCPRTLNLRITKIILLTRSSYRSKPPPQVLKTRLHNSYRSPSTIGFLSLLQGFKFGLLQGTSTTEATTARKHRQKDTTNTVQQQGGARFFLRQGCLRSTGLYVQRVFASHKSSP